MRWVESEDSARLENYLGTNRLTSELVPLIGFESGVRAHFSGLQSSEFWWVRSSPLFYRFPDSDQTGRELSDKRPVNGLPRRLSDELRRCEQRGAISESSPSSFCRRPKRKRMASNAERNYGNIATGLRNGLIKSTIILLCPDCTPTNTIN
jgi:hypothetical protein